MCTLLLSDDGFIQAERLIQSHGDFLDKLGNLKPSDVLYDIELQAAGAASDAISDLEEAIFNSPVISQRSAAVVLGVISKNISDRQYLSPVETAALRAVADFYERDHWLRSEHPKIWIETSRA